MILFDNIKNLLHYKWRITGHITGGRTPKLNIGILKINNYLIIPLTQPLYDNQPLYNNQSLYDTMDSEIASSIPESSIISESTISKRGKGKSIFIIWIYIRYFQPPNEPEFKGKSRILYYKYYPSGLSYGTIVTTNFRKHLEAKYIIIIKKDLGPL